MYMCQVFVANAYIKPDRILLVQDMTPIMASSNFKRWLKTPTENKVPGKLKKFVKKLHTLCSMLPVLILVIYMVCSN